MVQCSLASRGHQNELPSLPAVVSWLTSSPMRRPSSERTCCRRRCASTGRSQARLRRAQSAHLVALKTLSHRGTHPRMTWRLKCNSSSSTSDR